MNWKPLIIIPVLILVGAYSVSALDNPSFFKGFTHMNNAHYDEAIMYFNISIKANPDYLPAYSHLALCYERKEDYTKAAEVWSKYSEFDSYFKDTVIIHIELIDKFLKAGEYIKSRQAKEAMPLLEEIVATDKYPMSVLWVNAAKILGGVYFEAKSYDRVINLYEKISLYYPKDVTEEILFRYAHSYQQAREFQKAIDIYKKLDQQFKIEDEKNITKYKNMVSLCYEGLGDEAFAQDDHKKAKEIYEIVIEGFPMAENIDRVSQKKQKVEEHLAFFYKTEGNTYAKMKEYSNAIEFYEKLVNECAESSERNSTRKKLTTLKALETEYKRKAFRYYHEEKFEESMELCQLLLKQFPKGKHAPWAQKQLGSLYGVQGQYQKAISELLKVAKNYPDSCYADDALERAGVFFWCILKEKDKALKIFKYIARKYPKGNYADRSLYYMGVIYLQNKDYERGYYALQKLLKEYPDSDMVPRTKIQIVKLKEIAKKKSKK